MKLFLSLGLLLLSFSVFAAATPQHARLIRARAKTNHHHVTHHHAHKATKHHTPKRRHVA